MMRITQRIAERNKDYYGKKPVTIVCLGDSVTHGCFDVFVNRFGQVDTVCDTPAGYPMLLQKALLRLFPFSAVNVINASISGDSTTGALKRFDRDVAPFHPDLVTVNLGLNDCCAADPEASLANYMNNLRAIFRKIDELGAESMLVTPNMMCAYVDPSLEAEPLKKVAEMVAQANRRRAHQFRGRSPGNRPGIRGGGGGCLRRLAGHGALRRGYHRPAGQSHQSSRPGHARAVRPSHSGTAAVRAKSMFLRPRTAS